MIGVYLVNYGGDIEFQLGIRVIVFMLEKLLQKAMNGFKMRMY